MPFRAALFLLVLTSLAACRSRLDGPGGGTVPSAPQPRGLTAAEAREALFAGLADVDTPLTTLRRTGARMGGRPRLIALPSVERAVARRFPRGTRLGPLRQVAAFGISALSPRRPHEVADLFLDPDLERRALDAARFAIEERAFDLAGMRRFTFRVEMPGKGAPPWVFDFRFSANAERWDLDDGSVLIRYDPARAADAEGVTLYRGVCVIEPAGSGSRVTEMLILGSDVRLPFFLRGIAQRETYRLFQDRVTTLWRAM